MKATIQGVEYETVNTSALTATNIIINTWKLLGKPQSPFTKTGAKLMDLIIAVWEDLYPVDRETWYAERKRYKTAELSINEQVAKGTGRSLASYPMPIFKLMQVVFRGFDPAERKNCIRMVRKWPMFQMANKV